MAKYVSPMGVIVDALVHAGLVDASEVNDIVQIVFDLKEGDMPAMYVRKLFDVNQLALAIDTSSRGGGISIERESVEPRPAPPHLREDIAARLESIRD